METIINNINKFFELSQEAFEADIESFENENDNLQLETRLKLIKKLKLKPLSEINKYKNNTLYKIALKKNQDGFYSGNNSHKLSLQQFFRMRSPQFQFRNIENLNEYDLKDLLSDIDLIKIIEDLDNNENYK